LRARAKAGRVKEKLTQSCSTEQTTPKQTGTRTGKRVGVRVRRGGGGMRSAQKMGRTSSPRRACRGRRQLPSSTLLEENEEANSEAKDDSSPFAFFPATPSPPPPPELARFDAMVLKSWCVCVAFRHNLSGSCHWQWSHWQLERKTLHCQWQVGRSAWRALGHAPLAPQTTPHRRFFAQYATKASPQAVGSAPPAPVL
jgi:hypothetical protein